MHLTSGYELTTSITNLFIFIVSFYGFIKTNKKEKLWKLFFLLMSIDSLLGVVIHGISMTITTNIILWIILSISFTITVNTFLIIFLKYKIKHILLLSVLLSILLLTEIYNGLDFILTFAIYVLITMIISLFFIIKDNLKNKKYFILAIIFQLIGGLFMISDIKLLGLNHNGIYHLFMTITMILLVMGTKRE